MIRAGKFRHRVTVQKKTGAQDSYGAETDAWTPLGTVWAAVEPLLQGNERFAAAHQDARHPTLIRMRWPGHFSDRVEPQMRIVFGSRVFDIISAADVFELGRELHVLADELVGKAA